MTCNQIMHIGLLLHYISLLLIHKGGCDSKNITKTQAKYNLTSSGLRKRPEISNDNTEENEIFEEEIWANNSDFGPSRQKLTHIHVRSKETDNIGGQNITFRVVNGERAALGDVPWQVALVKQRGRYTSSYTAFCGGVLISPTKILSAAHCFDTNSWSKCNLGVLGSGHFRKMYAVMGSIETTVRAASLFSPGTPHAQFRQLKHGRYPKTFKFPKDDIAVLEQSTVLLLAYLQVIPTNICNKIHFKNMSHFVCTSDVKADVHKGDSGGPLVCFDTGDPNEKDGRLVVGIVSGKKMDRRSSTFFTRITSYYTLVSSSLCSLPSLFVTVLTLLLNCTFLLF